MNEINVWIIFNSSEKKPLKITISNELNDGIFVEFTISVLPDEMLTGKPLIYTINNDTKIKLD